MNRFADKIVEASARSKCQNTKKYNFFYPFACDSLSCVWGVLPVT